MRNIKLEICVDSLEGAVLANDLGADSVELNQALDLGGLTPSLGLIRQVKDIAIDKYCMIRPRPGGFIYSQSEYDQMKEDLKILLQEDIQGIVFGFLTEDLEIDLDRTKFFVDQIKAVGKKAIFHRAFDNAKDPYRAFESLIELGVDRVLTSGQKASAYEGLGLIRDLQSKYGSSIEIIAGAGINETNVEELVNVSKIEYVHSSARGLSQDISTKTKVSYETLGMGDGITIADQAKIKALVEKIKKIRNYD